MVFLDNYSHIREMIEKEMELYLSNKIHNNNKPILDEFYQLIRDHVFSGGKRLRPLCMVMGYRGYVDDYKIIGPSISPELVHSSSLILDDAMDEDVMRHGKPTFNAIYADKFLDSLGFNFNKYSLGRYWIERDALKDLFYVQRAVSRYSYALSVLGSNVMYSMSMEVLGKSEFDNAKIVRALDLQRKMYQTLNEGQLMDILYESMHSNEEEYLAMIHRKTGILFTYPIRIGLVFAGREDERIMDGYANAISTAFQIRDDILGTFGSESLTGKSAFSDIVDGKRTLLVIKAMENASDNDRKFLEKILGYVHASKEDINAVRGIFKDTGAYEYCQSLAKRYIEESKSFIPDDMSGESREFFSSLADFIVNRER
ncbi:MAG TPA: polyprenyl synthetase family protein [Candidatus Methanofastidiosa archaeon]|nr:polyprenyl synthetase family protein [Candidatus Methanofastidiosa archaeon]HPR42173.1 polyprenyl synthetase family protein [Candidatus Methanofastidiosa archaeon]